MNYTKQQLEKIMESNGGWLDLRDTPITALPEGLTVGGSLDLRGTPITALPEGLTVGGSLYLSGTPITNPNNYSMLHNGSYKENSYLYCDNILTHVREKKEIKGYSFYIGKIKGKNVVGDGTFYAHCRTFKEGVLDIEFKKSKNRGADQYKHLTFESVLTYEEAIVAYRIITGACKAGTQQFLDGLKEIKEKYTVAEIIEATKGQFGNTVFEDFIKRNAE